jgi:hypothetical protein
VARCRPCSPADPARRASRLASRPRSGNGWNPCSHKTFPSRREPREGMARATHGKCGFAHCPREDHPSPSDEPVTATSGRPLLPAHGPRSRSSPRPAPPRDACGGAQFPPPERAAGGPSLWPAAGGERPGWRPADPRPTRRAAALAACLAVKCHRLKRHRCIRGIHVSRIVSENSSVPNLTSP